MTILDAGALTHGQVNAQIGAAGDTVMTPPLTAFLTDCFASWTCREERGISVKPNRNMVVLQVVMTCLVAALGTIALVDGRIVVGVLLVALACARVGMILEASPSPCRTLPAVPGDGRPEPLVARTLARRRAVGCVRHRG